MSDSSFHEFARDRAGYVLSFCMTLTGNRHDAEDLAQDAMFRAYRKWRQIRAADSPDAYLRRLVLNEFLSAKRRSRVPTVPLTDALIGTIGGSGLSDHSTSATLLRQLVVALPPQQRAALAMYYYLELSTAQIGAELGIGESSVRSAIARARATLKNEWNATNVEDAR